MSAKTDPAASDDSAASSSPDSSSPSANAATAPPSARQRNPRFALFIATAAGLGYLPKAPGTWGSLAGLLLAVLPWWALVAVGVVSLNEHFIGIGRHANAPDPLLQCQVWIWLTVAAIGVWAASRAADYWSQKDPQRVVIDEVSGQHLALFLGCALPVWWKPQPPWIDADLGFVTSLVALNWKYLLLGFILFRVFDIWKPFPARQAESLPGGWGIMADDWIAGAYAAIGLWLARAAGL
jgi:phosphatidylglycerophosphatase A